MAQRPQGSFLKLDGDGDFMQWSDYADSLIFDQPVTIEFWLRANFEHYSAIGMIWVINDGNPVATTGAESFELRYGANTSSLDNEWISTFYSIGNLSLTNLYGNENQGDYAGQWLHYAVVADGSEYRLYINGEEQILSPSSATGNGLPKFYGNGVSPGENVALGARFLDDAVTFAFNGNIDEFRLWNISRSASQIQRTMNDTLKSSYYSTSDSGLVGYWRFEEIENLGIREDGIDDMRDYSVHGYHGDLEGDAAIDREEFTEIDANLPGISDGNVVWGDYDNDGDFDILLAGSGSTKIYRNENHIFTDINAPLAAINNGSIAWGDYDNDEDLDILLAGSGLSRIYRNDNGVYTDINASLTGVRDASVAWGDYNNNGLQDIIITGSGTSKIYNNNYGVFTDINAPLQGVSEGSVAGDFDNDGDLDILLTGYNGDTDYAKVYRNDDSTFTDINAPLTEIRYSSVAWIDYDNDGDLDISTTGLQTSGVINISNIYRNTGGTFAKINAPLSGVYYGSSAWGDHDIDGNIDFLLTGYNNVGELTSTLYRNNGSTFTAVNYPFTGVVHSSVAWGDYDNDMDLDILLSGSGNFNVVSNIYRNDSPIANIPPSAPQGLITSKTESTALLSGKQQVIWRHLHPV